MLREKRESISLEGKKKSGVRAARDDISHLLRELLRRSLLERGVPVGLEPARGECVCHAIGRPAVELRNREL